MAEAAVVDDMVELDRAVIGGGRDEVVDDGRGIERCRRTIRQEVEAWGRGAHPGWLLDVTYRPIGEREQTFVLRHGARVVPQFGKALQVGGWPSRVRGWATRGQGYFFGGHAGEGELLQVVGAEIEKMAATEQQ